MCTINEFMRILSKFMAFSVVIWLFSGRYGLYTVFKGSNHAEYLTMMYYHHFDSINLKFAKIGTFWPFLATFGIENGSMITLAIFGDLKFAKNKCHIGIHIIKLKRIWTHWVIFHILKIC